LTKVQTVTCRW